MGHIRPEWIHGYGDADAREQTRVTKMTNNQIPITNEKDNDQFTNNQLNEAKGGLPVSFLSWLLVIVCFSGLTSDVNSRHQYISHAATF
ncbi:MAG TPA: hypothetical protein PKJ17_07740, partial [Syntrophorhabdaceae bacterium]|nr:hypothetical protein [Syntrophorhabdaceae bacterium]